jgi:hypothetical protein
MRVTSARTAWLRLAGGPAERRALAVADMVIALTLAAAGRLAGEGIPESQIRVIQSGYDPTCSQRTHPTHSRTWAGRGSATSAGSPRRRTSAR